MHPDAVIATRNLSKTFAVRRKAGLVRRERIEVHAVSDVSVEVRRGEMVGYIGPNGAGKSTTIKMLSGILQPSSGTVTVAGYVPIDQRRALARKIGVVFGQRSTLWWDLPLSETFDLLRHVYKVDSQRHRENVAWYTEVLDLGPLLQVPVRQLSLGQRMRGEIAAALLHDPEVLFLDEPTIGLDVVSKHAVRGALAAMNRDRGVTVVLTTHDLADVEELCSRLVIIDRGKVIFDGPLAELMAKHGDHRTLVVDLDRAQPALDVPGIEVFRVEGLRQWLRFSRRAMSATDAIAAAGQHATITDLTIEEPEIEEIVRRIYVGE
jgi:ABC-2 type transport system ATP-binding protein